MDDFSIKVIKAKRLLLKLFPLTSSMLTYIPVKKGSLFSSIKVTKSGIIIKDGIEDPDKIAFLLLSASLMYQFAVPKRTKGFNKVLYYLASAIYSNELTKLIFYNNGLLQMDLLQFYLNIENKSLLGEISTEDLLKMSIDDIYKALLNKLHPVKDEINKLILSVYSNKIDSPEFFNVYNNLIKKLREIYRDEELTKKVANAILSSIERYVDEYNIKKSSSKMLETLTEATKGFTIPNASSLKEHLEKLLELNKMYSSEYLSVSKFLRILQNELKSILGKFIENPTNYKNIIYRNKLGSKIVYETYINRPRFKLYIAIDTSGSIEDSTYIKFINGLLNIINSLKEKNIFIKVLTFSGNVTNEFSLDSQNLGLLPDKLKIRSGYGGTIFNSVLERLENEKDLNLSYLIVFTDGLFYDTSLRTDILEKFRKVIFVTTNEVPKDISKLKNIKVFRVSS